MTVDNKIYTVRLAHWLRSFSQWDGWFLVLGGGIVLLGWLFENASLKGVLPGFASMNPVTALGFIIAGASLLCFWQMGRAFTPATVGSRALAGILVILGLLKLCEYEFNWHLSFDEVLFQNQIRHEPGVRNQIAPLTAFNFLFSGAGLWLLSSSHRRFSRFAQNIALALLFISLVPLVGYVYQARSLYSIGSFPMALNTAGMFCLLSLGILLAKMESGVVAVFVSATPGGVIARRLLPFAFGVPFTLGALVIWSGKKNFYSEDFGISIIVVGSFAAFSALIWWTAVSLNRADQKRCAAEKALQKAHDELEARVTERTVSLRQTNEALQMQILLQEKSEKKIREQAKLLDQAKDAILVLDMDHRITFWNKGAERIYGWPARETIYKSADDLLFTAGQPEGFLKILETGAWNGELQQFTKAGEPVVVESSWTLVKDESGRPRCILIINTDITEKKNYEAQLLRSQRMESLGALAGGIAHDLNNALAPVIMGAELLKQSQTEAKPRLLLDTILSSAKRGTGMVRQILSFARGSQSRTGPVEVDKLVNEMTKILNDTFPKGIAIQANLEDHLREIRGDATELHQVLLNLCVNARDAMPQGGQLTLAAQNIVLKKEDLPPNTHAAPGPFVLLSVADTGTGIPPHVLPRIFEPFFTTKSPDKGTGLGLSTVNNIVKHHNGFLQVQSQPGKGTLFKIFLPAVEAAIPAPDGAEKAALPTGHGELIMVVDDEQAVRELTKTTLEEYGYRVVTAANGFLGITCFEQYKDEIAAVVSDTDMPFGNGLEAVRSFQQSKPGVRIIIASGGKRNAEFFQKIDTAYVAELPKPYTVEQLLIAVAHAVKIREPQVEAHVV